MRDTACEARIEEPATEEHDRAIRALALMSLSAMKQAQSARWPCLVRPVSPPRMLRQAGLS